MDRRFVDGQVAGRASLTAGIVPQAYIFYGEYVLAERRERSFCRKCPWVAERSLKRLGCILCRSPEQPRMRNDTCQNKTGISIFPGGQIFDIFKVLERRFYVCLKNPSGCPPFR